MVARIIAAFFSIVLAFFALPVLARSSGSVAVPEPTDLALFALGVIGLIVGRQIAKKRD